jgi:hypothetical protein
MKTAKKIFDIQFKYLRPANNVASMIVDIREAALKAMEEYASQFKVELPTKQDACKKCLKDETMYDEPEEIQSKMLNRKEFVKSAYENGFLNCYDWLISKLQGK